MASYRIDSIAQLVRELFYTPVETSSLQVASAEDLLHEIETSRAYPLDYVVFRITGYHPRIVAPDLLTGIALQHDLGLLIEQLSDRQQLVAGTAGEPVLSIDDVTEQFNVTSKTVQRWRRRGLPARRFIFGDGKRRVGFLLSSVERFIRSNGKAVVDAQPNLSRIEAAEEKRMIRFARRLAVDGRCWPEEIARRIGKRLQRSPLTVLHTIRAHDRAHPENSIFNLAAKPIGERARARILRRYRKGWTLGRLAARSGRPRSSIYRIILDQQVQSIARRKTRFIDDPLYHQPDAEASIKMLVAAAAGQIANPPTSAELSNPLHSLCASSLLSAARERSLFLQLNFYRYQFVQARRKLDPQFAQWRQLRQMGHYLKRAADVRNEIVCANLRLVVSVAKKHSRPVKVSSQSVMSRNLNARTASSTTSLMDLVSDGSLTLMRAIDSFDIHRGNRFSTYATLSLMKGFAQAIAEKSGGKTLLIEPALLQRLPDRSMNEMERFGNSDVAAFLLGSLSDAERRVVRSLFGIGSKTSNSATEIAGRLGVSTARVRQIEKAAMAKMRQSAAVHY